MTVHPSASSMQRTGGRRKRPPIPSACTGICRAKRWRPAFRVLGRAAGYQVWRYGVSHSRNFANDWQLRIAFDGGRAMARRGRAVHIGGIDSVRLSGQEVRGDQGFAGRSAIPRLAGLTNSLSGHKLQGVLFYVGPRFEDDPSVRTAKHRRGGFGRGCPAART